MRVRKEAETNRVNRVLKEGDASKKRSERNV